MKPLQGKVAVVAGATRGAGRGIARALGEAGALVYCTGRSVQGAPGPSGRPETLEETAQIIAMAGGEARVQRTDHGDPAQIERLFSRVREEAGAVDILVNDLWGGESLMEWKPFWRLDAAKGFAMLDNAVRTHILTAQAAAAIMVEQGAGLIVEITDGDHSGYRGSLFYDLAKMGTIRLAFDMAAELSPRGVTALAVTPGFLRSEEMLERLGVAGRTWRDAIAKNPPFAHSETPLFVGRAIAALAADPEVAQRSGRVWSSWALARHYGFVDADGSRPDWGRFIRDSLEAIIAKGSAADARERQWLSIWSQSLKAEPEWAELVQRANAAIA